MDRRGLPWRLKAPERARLAHIPGLPAPTSLVPLAWLAPWGGYELSLSRVLGTDPGRFAELASALGEEWSPLFDRVRLLGAQLDEADRGPLHPELAEIRYAVRSDILM